MSCLWLDLCLVLGGSKYVDTDSVFCILLCNCQENVPRLHSSICPSSNFKGRRRRNCFLYVVPEFVFNMQPTAMFGIHLCRARTFKLGLLWLTLSTCAIAVAVNTTVLPQSPAPAEFSVRLVGGYSASSGRVQIFSGEAWGKLCLPRFTWTLKEAIVTCRQLGYPTALSSWEVLEDYSMEGVGTRDISCIGNETRLTECDYEPSKNHWCGHGSPRMYDVLVVCKPNEGDSEPPYLLELIFGKDDTEGSIQLRPFQSDWMVCSDSFDTRDATVVCRELGYEYALETFTSNQFYTDLDSYSYGLRFLDCVGNEKYLLECPHRIRPAEFCDADVSGVKCSLEPSSLPGEKIRLAGSANPDEGHLQTFYNGQWWNICNDGLWSEREANVTCRSMGFAAGWPLYTLRYTQEYKDTSSRDALITGFRCHGTESNLTQCLFDISLTTKCGFYDIAAVHCSSTSLVNPSVPYGVKLRLVNGESHTSGRVEVYQDAKWWSVCGLSGWDRNAAMVVCHQLGFIDAIFTGGWGT
ncbi:deleted in malignant brain tumors 1 protein-like [Asterias rubens]|uniref:deleted in malignant brain tumors 1 protein-like n=1 Tax=Asterias rubens TaxID=7604 RepID=UPI001455AEF1|nr:deleted in malignant brain tumors 1 protein-like [Asterias rubens]